MLAPPGVVGKDEFLEQPFGEDDVLGYLLAQRIDARERLFVAQMFDKLKFKAMSVEVSDKIQEMDLASQFLRIARNRWAESNIENCWMCFSAAMRDNGIHSWGRVYQASDIHVCGRKSERPADLVTLHNSSHQGVGAAEHA